MIRYRSAPAYATLANMGFQTRRFGTKRCGSTTRFVGQPGLRRRRPLVETVAPNVTRVGKVTPVTRPGGQLSLLAPR